MYRGQIPGYYFDEDKKKYFKIQANHVAPAGAKYAKSNVNYEKRETKKRKFEDDKQAVRARETVRRSAVLRHPLSGGVGLGREHGLRESTADSNDRDASFVSQLRSSLVEVKAPNASCRYGSLYDVITAETGDVIVGFNYSGGSSVYVVPLQEAATADGSLSMEHSLAMAAFTSPLVNVHTASNAAFSPTLLACAQESKSPGNLFVGGLPCIDCGALPARQGVYWRLGSRDSSLWSSALQLTSKHLALSGTESVCLLDIASETICSQLTLHDESRAIAWLDPQTVAYSEPRKVVLWDTRSFGKATRFHHTGGPITGIEHPDDNGLQLLVSDNRRIDRYDTRMEKEPVLSFKHVHQGPQLQFNIKYGLVAAIDVSNRVQVYSLRTGRNVGRLPNHSRRTNALATNLRWVDMDGMPGLQACQDQDLVRWTYGGLDDDEG